MRTLESHWNEDPGDRKTEGGATCAGDPSQQLVSKHKQPQDRAGELMVPQWARELTSELRELRRSGVLLALHQTWQLGGDKSLATSHDSEIRCAAASVSRPASLQPTAGQLQSLHMQSPTIAKGAAPELQQAPSLAKPAITSHLNGRSGMCTPHFENSIDTLETQRSSQDGIVDASLNKPNIRKPMDGSKRVDGRFTENQAAIPKATPHPPEPPSNCSSPRSILEEALLDP